MDSRPYLFLSKIKISSILLVCVQDLSNFLNKLRSSEMVQKSTCKSYNLVNHFKTPLSLFAGQTSCCLTQHADRVHHSAVMFYVACNRGFMPPFSTAALFSFIYWIFKSSCTVGVDLSWSCDYSFNYWHFHHSQSLHCLPSCWHEMESFQYCSLWALEPQPYTLCHVNILKSIEMLMSWFPEQFGVFKLPSLAVLILQGIREQQR